MEKKTLLAVYEDIVHATNAVADLQENKIRRADIGLAIRQPSKTEKQPKDALVTVSVSETDVDRVMALMQRHLPQKTDVRDAQWRLTDKPPFEPSEDTFVALDLAKIRTTPDDS
jgi:hypothetical protein